MVTSVNGLDLGGGGGGGGNSRVFAQCTGGPKGHLEFPPPQPPYACQRHSVCLKTCHGFLLGSSSVDAAALALRVESSQVTRTAGEFWVGSFWPCCGPHKLCCFFGWIFKGPTYHPMNIYFFMYCMRPLWGSWLAFKFLFSIKNRTYHERWNS